MTVTASYEYHGLPDYWCGNGRRWDNNAGCVFAYYGRNTTLRELVDELVNDYQSGGDTDDKEAFDKITGEDVRAAILASLTDQGRVDYESNAICEFSEEYVNANPNTTEDDDTGSPFVVFLLEVE